MGAWPKFSHTAFYALGAFLVFVSGCNKEEIQPPFYSIEVAGDYPMATEEWVFATDSEGNVLDAKAVSGKGITIQLHGNIAPLATFTLHHMMMFMTPGNPFLGVYARSYTDVPVGGSWHLQPTPFDFPPFSPAWVEIIDFRGAPETTRVSSVRGNMTLGDGIGSGEFPAEIEFAVMNSGDFVVTSFYNNTVHYGILHNITPFTHNKIALKPIDQPLVLNLTDANIIQVELAGYYNGDDLRYRGYINSEINQFQPAQDLTVGYINGFDTYRTLISYLESGVLKTYEKRGNPVAQVPDIEQPAFTVSSAKLSSLVGSISIPYSYAILDFHAQGTQHNLDWNVWVNGNGGTSIDFKLPELPHVIAERFPVLKVEFTNFQGGHFIQNKDGYQYSDKLDELADTSIPSQIATEYFSYRLNY
jgi:hypothetical protein